MHPVLLYVYMILFLSSAYRLRGVSPWMRKNKSDKLKGNTIALVILPVGISSCVFVEPQNKVSMSVMQPRGRWQVCCQMWRIIVFTEPKTSRLHTSILVSGWLFALCKTTTEPNETFAQWKIGKVPSQLAWIKIPHCPSSFSWNSFFCVLLVLLIE